MLHVGNIYLPTFPLVHVAIFHLSCGISLLKVQGSTDITFIKVQIEKHDTCGSRFRFREARINRWFPLLRPHLILLSEEGNKNSPWVF